MFIEVRRLSIKPHITELLFFGFEHHKLGEGGFGEEDESEARFAEQALLGAASDLPGVVLPGAACF